MDELCRSRRSEGYGVCDDAEAKVYTALVAPQRRSPFQRFFRFPALADGAFQVLGLFKSADD